MDPDTTLDRIRELIADVNEQGGLHVASEIVEELAELTEALDNWLVKGNFLPKAWGRGRF